MDEVLFVVADAMAPETISVSARDTVQTAKTLIVQHSAAALPVVEGDRVVGIVTPVQLLSAPPYRAVAEVMRAAGLTPVTPTLPVSQAYALMVAQNVDVLPVVEDGKLVGLISTTQLLRIRGRQNDPLTGLPSSTAIRAWAAAALERGHEVSILFFDLDNFGRVNKILGHVAGDDMLRTVARLLGSAIDVQTDLLCRYGGDEFAIATTRREPDAQALLRRIEDLVMLPIDTDDGPRQVTMSGGMAGGRRAEGRKRAHIAATVEDLLTLASRASTAAKDAKRSAETVERHEPAPSGTAAPKRAASGRGPSEAPRLSLLAVTVGSEPEAGIATVTLSVDTRKEVGQASGRAGGRALLFLVAEATLNAIRRAAGESHTFILEELHELPTDTETLAAVVLRAASDEAQAFAGAARAADLHHAVAKAILAAVNSRAAAVR